MRITTFEEDANMLDRIEQEAAARREEQINKAANNLRRLEDLVLRDKAVAQTVTCPKCEALPGDTCWWVRGDHDDDLDVLFHLERLLLGRRTVRCTA